MWEDAGVFESVNNRQDEDKKAEIAKQFEGLNTSYLIELYFQFSTEFQKTLEKILAGKSNEFTIANVRITDPRFLGEKLITKCLVNSHAKEMPMVTIFNPFIEFGNVIPNRHEFTFTVERGKISENIPMQRLFSAALRSLGAESLMKRRVGEHFADLSKLLDIEDIELQPNDIVVKLKSKPNLRRAEGTIEGELNKKGVKVTKLENNWVVRIKPDDLLPVGNEQEAAFYGLIEDGNAQNEIDFKVLEVTALGLEEAKIRARESIREYLASQGLLAT